VTPRTFVPAQRNRIHFIVGCPRSGTYLLSSILNSGGQIAIPTETHFIPLFLPYLWLAGDLRVPSSRKRLSKAIFIFLRIWLARAEEERDFAAVSKHSLLTVEAEADEIAQGARSYSDLVLGLFDAYARRSGASSSGDKSAFFHHMPLSSLDAATGGQARFIHVIRDGRDVCVSWRKIKVGPRSVCEAAHAWSDHVAGKRSWGAANPGRYHEMRYEDLLSDPEKTLRAVCEFVGFPYSGALLQFHKAPYARDIAASTTHSRLNQPLDSANHGKWRREMTPDEVLCFESKARAELIACGYPVSKPQVAEVGDARRTMPHFGGHRFRLALKGILPACALVAARLHLPLDSVCNSRPWLRVESLLTERSKEGLSHRSPGQP
jgi:hypothetical protein